VGRAIDVGEVIGRVFGLYREQAAVLLSVAALIFLVDSLVSAVVVSIGTGLLFLGLAVTLVASTLYQGMVVELVQDVRDGRRDSTAGELMRSVAGVLGPLLLAGLLAGFGIVLGFLALVVPGLFLLTIWAVVAPVVVVERPGVLPAFARSRQLVRGHGWQVFAVIVTFILLLVVTTITLVAIGAAFGSAGGYLASFVASVLTAPLLALAAGVLYFELREARGEVDPAPEGIADA
jgi:MFS family permease